MRSLRQTSFLVMTGAALAATSVKVAIAQVDVEPPMPNIMIMLDTSGSMMKNMNGSDPTCGTTGAALRELRWFAVVQALTGRIQVDASLGCREVPRTGLDFTDRYGNGMADEGYYIPFRQIMSNDCGLVPNPAFRDWNVAGASQWTDYPPEAIVGRSSTGTDCDFQQSQSQDGVIDEFKRRARFGLMTFDPLVRHDVGLTGVPNDTVDRSEGNTGTWSYWYEDNASNWYTEGGGAARGKPPACDALQGMEVGARNPAAPPWEGRLMGFGQETASSDDVAEQNENIEKIIGSMRPYGATPLAGMMSDLYDLILREEAALPGAQPRPLGAKTDSLWQLGQGCRPFHVILITDGEPNLDLRPDCTLPDPGGNSALDGVCPFRPIVVSGNRGDVASLGEVGIVNELHGLYNIVFHVVGLGVGLVDDPSNGDLNVSCSNDRYTRAGGARCSAGDRTPEERTCCILNSIQYEGNGNDAATYAGDSAALEVALRDVLDDIAVGTATRTVPVYQETSPKFVPGNAPAAGHEVTAALETVVGDGLWRGRLDRARIVCEGAPTLVPVLKTTDELLGDDFAVNLRIAPGARTFKTAVSALEPLNSWKTLRPLLPVSDADGLGDAPATNVSAPAASLPSSLLTLAMGVDGSSCPPTWSFSADECAANTLQWYTGQVPVRGPTRVSPLGAIYRSQPVIVGPPREFIRDEAYDAFAQLNATRPSVVYAASVDGQLHAFLMADNGGAEFTQVDSDTENNELWSFIPPIALGRIHQYHDKHALLLDGGITVRNLPGERAESDSSNSTVFLDNGAYKTFLVGSSGHSEQIEGGGYYYALDVTDPHSSQVRFLWQLSRATTGMTISSDDSRMFGAKVPPAAVTTISYRGPDNILSDVPVAILAGGVTGGPLTGSGAGAYTGASFHGSPLYNGVSGGIRGTGRNWGSALRPDRSITIVRVDTGEILYRFVGQAIDDVGFGLDPVRRGVVGFSSPMSGTPVAYPGLPGQVSTRVFIGDADGFMWAVNLANPDPAQWTMEVAWDPYRSFATDSIEIGGVENVPLVSVSDAGDPVVIFATGTQEDYYRRSGTNFVVSFTDTPVAAGYEPQWELNLSDSGSTPGQRVTGSLNLFNRVVYFATFVPNDNSCTLGGSRIWALDYSGTAVSGGVDFDGDVVTDDLFVDRPGEIIFGVTIGQEPSCKQTLDTSESDDVFGGYSNFTSSPPGTFQLVALTGRPAHGIGDINSGIANDTPPIARFELALPSPTPVVRVDSWAAIVE